MRTRITLFLIGACLLLAIHSRAGLSLPGASALLGSVFGLITIRHWRLSHSIQASSTVDSFRHPKAPLSDAERSMTGPEIL